MSYAEGNPHLADPFNGKCESSWICLDMGVMKDGYSVTVPDRAFAYFNCFTTTNTPADIMDQMRPLQDMRLTRLWLRSPNHTETCLLWAVNANALM